MTNTDLPVVNREAPAGYRWPGADVVSAGGTHYWLEPQPGWTGATPLFAVMSAWPGGQAVVAERCHRKYGVEIVHALRVYNEMFGLAKQFTVLSSPNITGEQADQSARALVAECFNLEIPND